MTHNQGSRRKGSLGMAVGPSEDEIRCTAAATIHSGRRRLDKQN